MKTVKELFSEFNKQDVLERPLIASRTFIGGAPSKIFLEDETPNLKVVQKYENSSGKAYNRFYIFDYTNNKMYRIKSTSIEELPMDHLSTIKIVVGFLYRLIVTKNKTTLHNLKNYYDIDYYYVKDAVFNINLDSAIIIYTLEPQQKITDSAFRSVADRIFCKKSKLVMDLDDIIGARIVINDAIFYIDFIIYGCNNDQEMKIALSSDGKIKVSTSTVPVGYAQEIYNRKQSLIKDLVQTNIYKKYQIKNLLS